ncbi:GGDEF domain-containing protein [Sulfuricurvum sp.]|uniref:GGDEF domain-containing protein n=1 Tax=Sulfuricurvum sp. TaxID=2025608 RepID=UPI00262BD70F|nr:GGDEF domain-containing protein [Sulfuricurvum sp.]MDD2780076.1 GGDEF domain-containing protein [Sulfuricurvum sp.]
MYANQEILQIISHETINATDSLDVITPSIYSALFFKFAAEHGLEINDEVNIADSELNEKITLLTNLSNETSKNMQQLSESTNKAITAIQTKDETILNEVLSETKMLREEIEKLKASVYKDELTGLFNRKWVHDTFLDGESQYFKHSGTLAMIDLNYFKAINDTFGHIIGDKVLMYIANSLTKVDKNIVRYGGDEFMILFSNEVSERDALNKLTSLRENILSKKLKAHDTMFRTSFSFGVSAFQERDNLIDIIELADKNMYDDKIEIKKRVTGLY